MCSLFMLDDGCEWGGGGKTVLHLYERFLGEGRVIFKCSYLMMEVYTVFILYDGDVHSVHTS